MLKSWDLKILAAAGIALMGCESQALDSTPRVDEGTAGRNTGAGGANTSLEQRVLEDARVSSDQAAADFQRAVGEVDFGSEPVERAALRVELRSPCFPFSNWQELGVPPGQRWPAACDAFDRTVQITLDDPEDGESGAAFELIRAITPFGGPAQLEADVTDFVNGLPGKHRLAVHIDTWSDAEGAVSGSAGEWYVSATLESWPGAAPRQVLAVTPVVLETQTEADAAPVSFEVPAGVGSARLEYRATGHGGVQVFTASCRGPAEEFCRRTHELSLDGELLAQLDPWRDDCATLCTTTENTEDYGPASYCAENPCGDPRSVRAPRANWCPGSTTPPFVIEAGALTTAGRHELTRRIAALAPGGQWTVSATYFAFE